MTTALVYWLEILCYSGNILSGIIAYNIWNMQEKTHINKIFLVYFAIDCSIGIVEPYFLFKVQKQRLDLHLSYQLLNSILLSHCVSSLLSSKL